MLSKIETAELTRLDRLARKNKATRSQLCRIIDLRVRAKRKPMPCPVCGVDRCNDINH